MSSEIDFSTAGLVSQPSPSIWADCPRTLLVDKGLGYYAHEEFLGIPTGTLAAALDVTMNAFGNGLSLGGDTNLVVSSLTAKTGGFVKGVTAATDNNGFSVFSVPLGAIVLKSGNKFWFETAFQMNELSDEAVFVGLTEEASANHDVILDDPSNTVTAATDATHSVVGFASKQTASAVAQFDAIYKKGAGTVVSVLTNVTQAGAIPTASQAALAATTAIKLGVRFDGRDKITFYANGYKVATQTVDATIDQAHNLCAIVAFKTGTAAARGIAIDWVRYAFQARS